jgi:hypothetical protein
MIPEGGVSRYEIDGVAVYIVWLRNNFLWEIGTDRFYETFVHELIHIFYFLHGFSAREDTVEREGAEFYASNQAFVRKLYESVTQGPQYFVWNPPPESPLTPKDRLRLIEKRVLENRSRSYVLS